MFTFVYLYIFAYYLNLLFIMMFIVFFFYSTALSSMYLTTLFAILKKYNASSKYLTLLMLLMSGLPPVTIFFIKFNFLLIIIQKLSIINQLLIYINLFLAMLYYLQIFTTTNSNYYLTSKEIHKLPHNHIKCQNKATMSYTYYKLILSLNVYLALNLFFIVFVNDFYLIIYNWTF